jgi:type IV pilus assembly protein PilV
MPTIHASVEAEGRMKSKPEDLSQYASASCDDYSRCADWKRKLQTQLPAADATVTVDATSGEVNITIVWTQPGEGEHRYISSAMVQP